MFQQPSTCPQCQTQYYGPSCPQCAGAPTQTITQGPIQATPLTVPAGAQRGAGRRRRLTVVIILLALILILAGGGIFLLKLPGHPAANATNTVSTSVPTASETATPTAGVECPCAITPTPTATSTATPTETPTPSPALKVMSFKLWFSGYGGANGFVATLQIQSVNGDNLSGTFTGILWECQGLARESATPCGGKTPNVDAVRAGGQNNQDPSWTITNGIMTMDFYGVAYVSSYGQGIVLGCHYQVNVDLSSKTPSGFWWWPSGGDGTIIYSR